MFVSCSIALKYYGLFIVKKYILWPRYYENHKLNITRNEEYASRLNHTLPTGEGTAPPPHVASIEPKVKDSYSLEVAKLRL